MLIFWGGGVKKSPFFVVQFHHIRTVESLCTCNYKWNVFLTGESSYISPKKLKYNSAQLKHTTTFDVPQLAGFTGGSSYWYKSISVWYVRDMLCHGCFQDCTNSGAARGITCSSLPHDKRRRQWNEQLLVVYITWHTQSHDLFFALEVLGHLGL